MSPLRADEQTGVYRIVGLSAPERQDDLRAALKDVPNVQLEALDFDKGEATLRFDAAKLLPGSKTPSPEAIIKRLDDLLLNASNHTFNVTAPSTLPAEKLTKLEIKVGLLDCKGCRYAVYCVVGKMDGVVRATVSSQVSTGTVNAWIDGSKTNIEALTEALKKANVPFPEK